ncbi:MAG TPA: ArgR family transcriptional regulator [Gammaproteobacteria bacterium]|nr:ArgR family transcriptional regulator [Gammaproteobacteria bacterium]
MNDTSLDDHILNIIRNFEIPEQADLQSYLNKRGFDIPQATLSRRLKKLNVAKVSGIYEIVDHNQPQIPTVLSMKESDSGLLVFHTHPGNANSLAVFLDEKFVSYSSRDDKSSLILGTIAGDDTVLVIVKNKTTMKEFIREVGYYFPYLPQGG